MSNAYTKSGVNISEGERVVQNIKSAVTSTWNENVKSKFGDFAGMYSWNDGILVTSTDGVGTKTIATLKVLGSDGYHSLGQDIVNHCVNDILVKGARPLFFLDYIASSQLNAEHVTNFVTGVAKACRNAGCALIGGETAEMPDVYNPKHTDIVGTIVGAVTPETMIDGPSTIINGDIVIGLRSSGPHTNGYSLIRKLILDLRPEDVTPHRCYLSDIEKIRNSGVTIKGLCHITGGGWWGNIKRVLPEGFSVNIVVPREPEESIFTRVQRAGGISDEEMLSIFNMGFGMLVFVDCDDYSRISQYFSSDYAKVLGTVQEDIVPQIIIR